MTEQSEPSIVDKELYKLKRNVRDDSIEVLLLAILYVLLGFCSLIFYTDKGHLFVFGLISCLQLVSGILGLNAIEKEEGLRQRLQLMILAVLNIIWITSALLVLIIYWLLMENVPEFNNEVALHIGCVVFVGISLDLTGAAFMLMRRLDSLKVTLKRCDMEAEKSGGKRPQNLPQKDDGVADVSPSNPEQNKNLDNRHNQGPDVGVKPSSESQDTTS